MAVVPPGGGGAPGGGNTGLDLFLNSTGANWPLIRFLLDDPVYRAAYRAHIEELITTVFDAGRLTARLRSEQALIAPYVIGAEGEQSGRTFLSTPAQFETAVTTLDQLCRIAVGGGEAAAGNGAVTDPPDVS